MMPNTIQSAACASARALLCLIISLFICSCTRHTPGRDAIDLSGRWELIPADSNATAGMQNRPPLHITLPGSWNNILRRNSDRAATIWLKKTVRINEAGEHGPYVLSLGRIGVADETYVNGIEVGSSGVIPGRGDPLNYRSAWQVSRNYFVPGTIIRNGENTITIRVFSHLICGMADYPELAPEREWKDRKALFGFPAVTAAHAGILTANAILLIIALIIFFNDRTRREFSLNLLILAGAIILHLFVLGFGWFAGGLVMLKIQFGLYTIAYLLFTLVAEMIFSTRIKYMNVVMAGFTAIILLSLAVTPTTQAFVRYSGSLYIVFSIIYHIYVPAILIMMIIRDPMRYWYLSIVTVFCLGMDIYYLYCLVSLQLMNIPFHISQATILFILAIILFTTDYSNVIKENSSMAKALLGKTREIQKLQKLFNSMKKGRFKEEPREAINDVIEYLDGNYFEPYDRKDLADRFTIKEDYMCQVFKKKTGTSISNYLNKLRIDAAKKMLEETDSRVVDIAFHIGFENLTHFHRLFKKMTGTTPANYREKMTLSKMIEKN